MDSLQPGCVEESSGVTDDHPAISRNWRYRPPAVIGHGLGAVPDHLSAFEQSTDKRMLLEFLQHALGIEPGIGIVDGSHETERDHSVLAAINPRAAVLFRGQRPAHRVDDFPRRHAPRGQFPQFLYSHAISLRIAVAHEIKFLNQLLGQRATRAFGENGYFRLQIVTRFKIRFGLVLLVYALVVGPNTSHTIAIDQ